MAVRCGYENIVRILLENGADMTRKFGCHQYTVLRLAIQLARIDIMKLLLDARRDTEIVRHRWKLHSCVAAVIPSGNNDMHVRA